MGNNKGLLTKWEICPGKYLPEVLVQTERQRSEVYAKKKCKCFPEQTEQTRLIRLLLYGVWFIFFTVIALCSSSDVALYPSSEFLDHVSYLHTL